MILKSELVFEFEFFGELKQIFAPIVIPAPLINISGPIGRKENHDMILPPS